MFAPFTKNSELVKKLRENEEKIFNLTKSRYKIVERAGVKLQDLLTTSNPWKGSDCSRENCLLCITKQKTGKHMNQECTKRNVVYETWCMTCQEKEEKMIMEEYKEEEWKERMKKMKIVKYIGESSRSCFERGWEHLNDMASLKSTSHMLRHLVTCHEDADFSDIQFGMKVAKFTRSSFDRQILEAVLIDQEKDKNNIHNAKAEYNRSSLPKLSASTENETIEKRKRELFEEEKKENEIEEKIRKLRKERNKARLLPSIFCNCVAFYFFRTSSSFSNNIHKITRK